MSCSYRKFRFNNPDTFDCIMDIVKYENKLSELNNKKEEAKNTIANCDNKIIEHYDFKTIINNMLEIVNSDDKNKKVKINELLRTYDGSRMIHTFNLMEFKTFSDLKNNVAVSIRDIRRKRKESIEMLNECKNEINKIKKSINDYNQIANELIQEEHKTEKWLDSIKKTVKNDYNKGLINQKFKHVSIQKHAQEEQKEIINFDSFNDLDELKNFDLLENPHEELTRFEDLLYL